MFLCVRGYIGVHVCDCACVCVFVCVRVRAWSRMITICLRLIVDSCDYWPNVTLHA
jgi:hypothetical protein